MKEYLFNIGIKHRKTGEKIDFVSPGVKGQKVLMNIPVKCENNWIMRRKKGN